MLYITGDIHGKDDFRKLSPRFFPLQDTLSGEDFLLVAGDFGLPSLPWSLNDDPYLDDLASRPYTTLFFVSKIEVSRRRPSGLEAVAEKFGGATIETTMEVKVPEGLESERSKLKGLFVKTYTPLAIFLMKMQAVASPSRRTARDVYDMAYIWSRLGLGSEDRKEFLSGCVRAFAESGMKQAERDMFMTMLREKGDRFLQDLDDGADLQFSSPVDKDETGLFVLGFIDEFSSFVERDATMGLSL